jgi:hypothetical protein
MAFLRFGQHWRESIELFLASFGRPNAISFTSKIAFAFGTT